MNLSRYLPLAAAIVVLAAPSAVLAAPPATADVNAGLQALRDFNLVTLKDFGATNNVDGRAFVGGNVTSQANFFTNPKGQTGTALTVAGDVKKGVNINNSGGLTVGGNVEKGANINGSGAVVRVDGNASSINANGSTVYVDGNVSSVNAKDIYYGGSIDPNSHGTLHSGDHSANGLQGQLQTQASALATQLNAASDYFASLQATDFLTYSGDGQKAIFDAGPGAGVAVFSLANIGDALKNRSVLEFVWPTGYDAVVINVAGSKITMPGNINFNGPTGLGSKVIWNFYEATELNFNGKGWYGSVLAPDADLKNYNFIEGSVAVNNVVNGGAIRMGNFAGDLKIGPAHAPIPEPATWIMMILGFGGAGAMLRRRRTARA